MHKSNDILVLEAADKNTTTLKAKVPMEKGGGGGGKKEEEEKEKKRGT